MPLPLVVPDLPRARDLAAFLLLVREIGKLIQRLSGVLHCGGEPARVRRARAHVIVEAARIPPMPVLLGVKGRLAEPRNRVVERPRGPAKLG
jgi:hypothetical protein